MIGYLNNDQEFIKKLADIVLANIQNENFGVNELARESGISRQSLNQKLQSITNKPINQFIREIRLQKALEILQSENVTASEVAYKVGFSSPAYFNTCFHEFFGYPPGQVKRTTNNIAKELNSIHVRSKHEQNRSLRRTFIYISSGILLLAVIVFLIDIIFIKDPAPRAGNSVVKDVDGNIYHTVAIGKQVWMAEDLKTTRYNDGNPIPYVVDNAQWRSLHSAAYCWYNNDESNKTVYGALYNWYTTNTNKLCPLGWHVSTFNDWEKLVDYCGGWEIAGGKLKEAGTAHWTSPNVGATNEFGFTALPSGCRSYTGTFTVTGCNLTYWCPPRCGDTRSICSDRAWIYLTETVASEGNCIRCVKNN